METIKKRVEYIDIFRGFGIILMIMGHIGFGPDFDYYIHAFHIPMFFFISGYFFNPSDISIGKFLKKKFCSLIVPYISFSAIHCLVYYLIYHRFSLRMIYCNILYMNTDIMPIAGALWFLTAMFFADVMYFLLNRLFKGHMLLLTGAVMASAAAGTLIPLIYNKRLPLAIDVSLVALGLYHIGRALKAYQHNKYVSRIFSLNFWLCCLLLIGSGYLVFLNGYINLRLAKYANVPLFWLNAVVLTITYLNIARIIDERLCKIPGLDKVICEFKFIGKNSIVYLCLNQLMILLGNRYVNAVNGNISLRLRSYKYKIVLLFLVLAALHMCGSLLTKTKLRVLLGRCNGRKTA